MALRGLRDRLGERANTALASLALGAALYYWAPRVLASYQGDFSAYWAAAKVTWRGGSPYRGDWCGDDGETFHRAAFLYPPTSLPVLLPLAAVSYHHAKQIWLASEMVFLLAALRFGGLSWSASLWLLAAALSFMRHVCYPLWSHLERGQAEILVLFWIALSWWLWRRERAATAGVALAIAAAIKPPAAILFLVPVMERGWRFLAGGVAAVAALVVSSTLLIGVDLQSRYWLEYFPHVVRTTRLPPGVEDWGFSHPGFRGRITAETLTWEGRRYDRWEDLPGSIGSFAHILARRGSRPVNPEARFHFAGRALSAVALLLTLTVVWTRGRSDADPVTARAWRWAAVMLVLLAWHPASWVMTYTWLFLIGALAWRHQVPLGWPARALVGLGIVCVLLAPPAVEPLFRALGSDGSSFPTSLLGLALWRRVAIGGLLLWAVALSRRFRPA